MDTYKLNSGNSENGGEFASLVADQREYFRSGATSKLSFRREQLQKLRKVILEEKDTLTDAVYKDHRRVANTTWAYELGICLTEIDYFLENLEEWAKPVYPEKTLATMLDTPMIVKEPKGVVLLIAPWNFPTSMVFLPLIPVIAAGNTVIIKPSEVSSHTAHALHEVLSNAFDKRFLAVVEGGVAETTELLKQRFDHIVYTGCTSVAKVVMTAAAKHLTPVTLELGGKCPAIVESDADIGIAAKRIAWGKWLNCGQVCLAPDYIIATETVKTRLVDALRKALQEFFGPDFKSASDYSRVINERHFDRLSSLLDKTQGVVLYKGGDRDRSDCFIPPVIVDVKPGDALMEEEIFGPILPIVTVRNFNEALELIRNGEKPLAAYVFTRDEHKVKRVVGETHSGAVTVNDVLMHFTVDVLPFGGVGNSGMGRYRGKFGFDELSHDKAVLIRGYFGESLGACRYPPLNDKKMSQLAMLGTRRTIPKSVRAILPKVFYLVLGLFAGYLAHRYSGVGLRVLYWIQGKVAHLFRH